MKEMIELRCACRDARGNHPLLGKAAGAEFSVQLKCKHCKKLTTFRHPHPLAFAEKSPKK